MLPTVVGRLNRPWPVVHGKQKRIVWGIETPMPVNCWTQLDPRVDRETARRVARAVRVVVVKGSTSTFQEAVLHHFLPAQNRSGALSIGAKHCKTTSRGGWKQWRTQYRKQGRKILAKGEVNVEEMATRVERLHCHPIVDERQQQVFSNLCLCSTML